MAIREIITLPNPILRKKARKIKEIDSDLQILIDDMIDTMRDEPGVGLAATQVAVSNRLIVVEYAEGSEDGESEEKPKLYVVINPEITRPSSEMVMGIEGCLSIPGLVGEVERHDSLVVKGLNRYGKPIKIKASGWLARIFQHEIDHLDGIVFTDRATEVWTPSAETEEKVH
jgi:peptide deformylase